MKALRTRSSRRRRAKRHNRLQMYNWRAAAVLTWRSQSDLQHLRDSRTLLAPLILVPIWAYHEHNAWLLAGIPVLYIASYSAAAHSKLLWLFLMLCIGVWLKAGFSFHQYITFFFFCSLWGYLFFELAESTQNEYALQSLIERPDIFNRAMAEHRIMVCPQRTAHPKCLTIAFSQPLCIPSLIP